ncbi:outer membrane efflux family protein [Parvularcula bermudensis HTCC2503]|uniref:Outer membrane efflux family protein n=1 Tax=Parvularcula bermudensis (strain ATCC BAA-594 / HTCC2503 / KCTC 12087) TaxID=314260 RepID=E0TD42_PARBH|nr:TolC family protein [Parvularcula bermudensis]ADM08701.1 outer membrane efflux family protein [Parvularcula bermudensis HTCC2503]
MKKLGAIIFLFLPACASVGPDLSTAPAESWQGEFYYGDDSAYTSDAPAKIAPWWQAAFDDDRLNRLVVLADNNNRDIGAALYRVEEAEARLSRARRALLPQGSGSESYSRTNEFMQGQGGQRQETDVYTLSADLQWELDVFGRIRRQRDIARAGAAERLALYEDVMRVVHAGTAQAYFNWLEADRRRAVAQQNLGLQEEALRLTQELVNLGASPRFDYDRQLTQARLTEAALVQLTAARADALSALALLCGVTVPELVGLFPEFSGDSGTIDVPDMTPTLGIPNPAVVIRQRPDIASAEAQYAQALYQIGVAQAELFPQLTFSGSVSQTAFEPEALYDQESFGFSYGPRLNWNVFSFPQLLAEVDATGKAAGAAKMAYENTVLNALTETDSALAQLLPPSNGRLC